MNEKKITLASIKRAIIWFLKSYIWIVPLVIIVDQVSKLVVEANLNLNEPVSIIPGVFSFMLSYNTGMAFSFLDNNRVLLAIISVVASIGIITYLVLRYKKLNLYTRICIYIILGGCMGNMIDRIFYPNGVIDFIKTDFIDFAIFNVADSCLTVAIIMLLIKLLVDDIKGSKKKNEATDSNNESK